MHEKDDLYRQKSPNPDVFDITRKPKGHLGFGGGVHACLGTAIARLALKAAVEQMLVAFPNIHLLEGQEIRWMPSSTFRSPMALLIAP